MSDMTPAAMKDFNQQVIDEFRANGGETTGPFAGAPLLLLTSTGAKSGQPRTSPVVHTRDGERYVIIASKAGAPTNPDWYHNLVANPRATIEVGTDTIEVEAEVAAGAERARLYDQQAALMPNFAEYAELTTREIPVMILTPVA
jgi:deazaflavin-dependent oxidoreductase (nitroreductase family)